MTYSFGVCISDMTRAWTDRRGDEIELEKTNVTLGQFYLILCNNNNNMCVEWSFVGIVTAYMVPTGTYVYDSEHNSPSCVGQV